LPARAYDYATWIERRAGFNFHAEIEKRFYSVPHTHMRRRPHVRLGSHTFEIFHRGDRIASHARSWRKYGYTTVAEHMPPNHRNYAEWSSERIERWAQTIGASTAEMCSRLMTAKRHSEQGFRACMWSCAWVKTTAQNALRRRAGGRV